MILDKQLNRFEMINNNDFIILHTYISLKTIFDLYFQKENVHYYYYFI